MTRTKIISLIMMLIVLLSCSDDEKNGVPQNRNIQGKIEKGPFVRGTKVEIKELDESLTPTGKSFTTTVIDHEGNFVLDNIALQSPYVQLIADGYFFNEVTGELSDSEISLQALANLNDGSSININILTHLKKDRIFQLIKQERLSYKEANTQAQTELLTNFGLQKYAGKEVNTFSISSGTDESGALIVVSATLLHNRTEAQLTEFMAGLSEDFKADGKFSAENKKDVAERCIKLNLSSIEQNITERYKSLGKDVRVPGLSKYIDWDQDGIAGNEFGSGSQELSFETDTLKVGKAGGTFKVKINGNAKYKFPNLQGGTSSEMYDLGIRQPQLTKSITDDYYLELKIGAAAGLLMEPAEVTVCTYDEQTNATLLIVQEGDFNQEIPSEDVKNYYTHILDATRTTFYANYLMEAFYTQCFAVNPTWANFYNHTLDAYNQQVQKGWQTAYAVLNSIRQLKATYKVKNIETGALAFTNLEAMVYYQLAVLWGNVVYVNNNNIWDHHPQVNEQALFDIFENCLLRSIQLSPEKKNNNLIFVSKDTPRAILAQMYMYTGKYDKALSLLSEIINNGDYQIESSRDNACKKGSKELIFSLLQDRSSEYSNQILNSDALPVITYTDILLSAAECEAHLGNMGKAASYLNSVRNKRGQASADPSTFTESLGSTWKSELKGFFSYFAYLKRNNLAEKELKINAYQKIFPIPRYDLDRMPELIQNPGY